MAGFTWTEKRQKAAILLAQGHTQGEVAEEVKVSQRTINRWAADGEFAMEVDRLSLMVGIASRAWRLRVAMRAARQMVSEEKVHTSKDLLDWLKYAQSETDGAKLDLTALLEAAASVAGS